MGLKKYCFDGSKKLEIEKMPTDSKKDRVNKEKIKAKTEENQAKISALQDRLYADGREGLIIVLQAMDAAGKDGTIKHVMNGVNPQGIDVHSFKVPNGTELSHDYLWRIHSCVPTRGKIAIFNRSHYEDVLAPRVLGLQKSYKMADRVINDDDFFKKRLRQIVNYEQYLYENSYRMIKIFLNVSLDTQKERFLDRINQPEKNWKLSPSDLKSRLQWFSYMRVYEDAVNATATKENPWYVLPADQKWYTRYLVSEAILKTLEDMDPQYPELPKEDAEQLPRLKAGLENGEYDEDAIREAEKKAEKQK